MARRESNILTAAQARAQRKRVAERQACDAELAAANGGSRKDGPLLEGPTDDPVREARELLGWCKANGLITTTKDGRSRLRSRGRQVLTILETIEKFNPEA